MHQLFVYGTLRKDGISHHLLQEPTIVAQGIWLEGYALYSGGWYPLAVPEPTGKIRGDIVVINPDHWPSLDAYEGEDYVRVFLKEKGFWMYQFIGKVTGLPKVENGDWLEWLPKKL